MAENPMTDTEFKRLRQFIRPYSALNAFVYRLTGGKLMGKLQGREVCLVTMTGAKSGKKRTVPLMYVPHPEVDGVIIVASQGGAPKAPVWYQNLIAHPDVEVQYRDRKMKLRARQVDDDEKARLWPHCCKHYPPFDDYQKRTDRNIPVFSCEPR